MVSGLLGAEDGTGGGREPLSMLNYCCGPFEVVSKQVGLFGGRRACAIACVLLVSVASLSLASCFVH
jgi:hypothetical protein